MFGLKESLALASSIIALSATLADAQTRPDVRVTIGGGSATDTRGVSSSALTIAPVLTVSLSPGASVALGANATKFANNAWSVGGSGGITSRRDLTHGLALSMHLSGDAARTSYQQTLASASLTPALEASVTRLSVFAAVRGSGGVSSLTTTTTTPGLLQPTPSSHTTWTSRGVVTPVFGGAIRLPMDGTSAQASLGYREERPRYSGVAVTDRALSFGGGTDAVALSVTAGRRMAVDEKKYFANGALTLVLSSTMSLDVAAGSYPSNRLLSTPGGRFVNAGISLRFGSGAPSLPKASGLAAAAPGVTRVTVNAKNAKHVDVAGDWNDWTPISAQRAPNGVWYADLTIPPGRYRYAFRIDGRAWTAPDGAAAVDDGFGGKAAWLSVPGAKQS